MKSKAGFTLVEIMIVVMIIGMLAAIALPSFQKARTTAQRNTCIENLRQINGNLQQYMMEQRQNSVDDDTLEETTFLDFFQRDALPTCPSDGEYGVGDAASGFVPTCTQNALGHVL